MGRPPIPIGAHGAIHVVEVGPRRFEARCRWRDKDGTFRRLRRIGASKTAAEMAITQRVAELADEVCGSQIGPSTRVRTVAEAWYKEIKWEASLGDRSPDSVRTYRVCMANQVLPRLGALRLNELTVTAMDTLIKETRDQHSYATAKTVRSVLRNLCAYAVRHQALRVNLALSVGRLPPGKPKEIHVLNPDQRLDLICRLEHFAIERRTDEKGRSLGPRARVWADLPDVVRALLATGVRLGELLALTGPDFARDGKGRPIVTIAAHIVRDDGQLVRKAYRKGNRNQLLLQVPEWSVPMWYERSATAGTGPMFAAWNGGWIHPDNLGHRLRQAFDAAGYPWVTSHVFRRTVASVLDEADLPTRLIADQLGHTSEATVRRHYIAPRVGNERSAQTLETMLQR